MSEADAFAHLNFVENSYQPNHNEGMYRLDSEPESTAPPIGLRRQRGHRNIN